MMYGLSGAMPMRMAHHCFHFQNQDLRQPPSVDTAGDATQPDPVGMPQGGGRGGAPSAGAGHCGKASAGGWGWGFGRAHGPFGRFMNAVSSAAFADRAQAENRASFRAEACEIRCGIRDLMKSVDGGQLTADQQETFDSLVGKLADLREGAGFRCGTCSDPERLGDRILARYGVERAPADTATECGCSHETSAETESETATGSQNIIEDGTEAAAPEGAAPAAGVIDTTSDASSASASDGSGDGETAASGDAEESTAADAVATITADAAGTLAADAAGAAVGNAVDGLLDELAA